MSQSNPKPPLSPAEVHRAGRNMVKALTGLISLHPFFGSLAMRIPVTEDASRETVASDGERLFFNPRWVLDTDGDTLKAAIARVGCACALFHHTRRGDREYKRWQEASRLVTLPILREVGLTNEQGGWDDCSVEQAYDRLPESPDDDGGSPQGQSQAQLGVGQGQGSGQGQGQGQPSHDPNGAGEVMDSPAANAPGDVRDAKIREAEQDWESAGHQAAQIAKAEGRRAAKADELIKSRHKAKAPWRDLLRQFMHAHAKDDVSWVRPKRRFIAQGLYLPSLHSEAMDAITFAVDTSSSMDKEALEQCWSEVREASAELTPAQVFFMACSTHVWRTDEYHPHQIPEDLHIKAKGGTRFAPVFEAMKDLPPAACMVYLTDGHCTDFGDEPECPVMWAIEPAGKKDFRPPFGEVIHLS